MSHIPKLEPRPGDPEPTPKHWLLRVATAFFGLGCIRWMVSGLDLIGRGESAMDLYKSLPKVILIIGHPAFGAIATVVGMVMFYFYGKTDTVVARSSTIIDPNTKRPVEKHGDPRKLLFQRTGKVFLVALCLALIVWFGYAGPIGNYIFVSNMPTLAISVPIPPDLHYTPRSSQRIASGEKPLVISPAPETKPAVPVAPTPPPIVLPRPSPQPPTTPGGPDSPMICPKEGQTIVGEWSIGRTGMSMNEFDFGYNIEGVVYNSLNQYLRQSIHPEPKRLTLAQLKNAISAIDEIDGMIPKQTAVKVNNIPVIPEVTLSGIKRNFNNDYIEAGYSTKLPNLPDNGSNGSINVPINSLSGDAQKTVSDFDKLAKAWGDASCKKALLELTTPQ